MDDIVNISEAKAQLSKLIERLETTGQETILARAGRPVAKLVRYQAVQKKDFIGMYEGQFKVPPRDEFKAWPEEEARALGLID